MAESWFRDVQMAPPVEVFALIHTYNLDTFSSKVNLTVGAFRTAEGKEFVLPVVRRVEEEIGNDTKLLHEYLPIRGLPALKMGSINLLFGHKQEYLARCGGVQCIGGTGALRIGLDFLKSRMKFDSVYMSDPTWPNHISICESLHYTNIHSYRYWNNATKCIDLAGMLEDLESSRPRSIIILQACAHNPTGLDPTLEEWKQIAEVVKKKRMFVFFDCAYQGFASGDVDDDAFAIRLFADMGFEMFVAQAFSKNFGLYDERVGYLTYFTKSPDSVLKIDSMMDEVVRTTYSTPPCHGAMVVARILNDQKMVEEWRATVRMMAERIKEMRRLLHDRLLALQTPGSWQHILTQKGMFLYSGLNATHAEHLIKHDHIYLLKDGRINMCAITTHNVDYVARCFCDVIRRYDVTHNGVAVGLCKEEGMKRGGCENGGSIEGLVVGKRWKGVRRDG